jgi:hypothetical protein
MLLSAAMSSLVVKLSFHIPRVLDECPAVGLQTGDGAANVFVDLHNLLHGACLQQCACHSLLHAEYDTLASLDSDGGAAELDGFERVFDLEETAFRGEGAGILLDGGWVGGSSGRDVLDTAI